VSRQNLGDHFLSDPDPDTDQNPECIPVPLRQKVPVPKTLVIFN
jgi:hypothetical protein